MDNAAGDAGRLFLPSTLLVAVRLEALAAFVLRHLQTSFLLEISHGEKELVNGHRATGASRCKARIYDDRGKLTITREPVNTHAQSTCAFAKPVRIATTFR